MTTKARLIEKINSMEDENHLEALLNYLEESNKTPIRLTEKDKKDIETSNQQLKNGKYLTQDDIRSKVQEWRRK